MKKNKAMRFASFLLVLTLLSTSVVSGTFAKYTTSATASDTARVAKWGVEIATWNTDAAKATLFKADYDGSVTAANGTDLVVAPGTKSDATIKFTVKGQAEVDLKLDYVMSGDVADPDAPVQDVFVKAGEYLDWTTGNDTQDKFTLGADYYPVEFVLTQTKKAGVADSKVVAKGNLAAIEGAFESLSQTTVEANTKLDEEYTLTWAWNFENTDKGSTVAANDQADTLLGNKAAGIAKDADASVNTTLKYAISITATQID